MGCVFLAHDSQLQRRVAVKVMISPLDQAPAEEREQLEQMFLGEAQLGASLTHPNIAAVYDFGNMMRFRSQSSSMCRARVFGPY